MNLVAVTGNVASDPEYVELDGEKRVARFQIAVNRAVGENADFFQVIAWNRDADLVRDYVQKGKPLAIVGRIQQARWTTKGKRSEPRSRVEIVATQIQFLRRAAA